MKTALALLMTLAALPAAGAEFPVWMAGSWRSASGDSVVEEHWTAADGGVMLGMSKTIRGNGKTAFEFLRIAEVDGKLAYLAMPGARPATPFPLKSAEGSRVVFENLGHDYPQRIIYWRDGPKLCARVEGTVKGNAEGEQWCYQRMGSGDGATTAAADPAAEVRQSETAFAAAFAARDRDKFFAFVADDATFLSPRRTLRGRREIVEGWSGFFEPVERPFSWRPERVAVNAAGTVGLSTGPVFDPKGNQTGVYSSVWVRQPDGSWKILFDGPGCPKP